MCYEQVLDEEAQAGWTRVSEINITTIDRCGQRCIRRRIK